MNGITNTWFNPNLTEIVKHIREGTLDFVLLKPIDSQFFISLKKINPSGILEIMLGLLLLFLCIKINQINLNLSFLTLSLITISCSICILYSLWFFISTTTIWFVKTWNAIEVLRSFLYIGRFPLNSFSFSLRIFFSIFIPIAFITTIPSEVFLGLSQLWKILLEVIVATIISSNIFQNTESPRKTSEGIVVIKAIGIKTLKNILRVNENEFRGNLPI